jgi:hypothetical protein
VRFNRFTAILILGLVLGAFAMGNYASGQASSKMQRWEYSILKHSPLLKEGGTDFAKMQKLGKEGWELSSSYAMRGEVIISIFKRKR